MDDIIPLDAPQKQCTDCKQWKKATRSFFPRTRKSSDGLRSVCLTCYGSKPHVPDGQKWCKKCRNIWPATLDFFFADNREPGGLRMPCKQCIKDYEHTDARQEQKSSYWPGYYQANKQKCNRRTREWYYTYHEACKAYQREYGRTRRPKKGPRKKVSIEERRARKKIQARERYRRNPERVLVHINKRKAVKRSVLGTHTAAQIQEQLKRQKYRCYYAACGFSKFPKVNGKYVYDIEHTFPLSRVAGTGIPANGMSYLVLACPHCNQSKHDKFPWEWPQGGRLL